MFSFASKSMQQPVARQPQAPHGPAESNPSSVAAKPAGRAEKVWWMDSAHELERGLEVTEMADLPEELFSGARPSEATERPLGGQRA